MDFRRYVSKADIRSWDSPPVMNVVCTACIGSDGLARIVYSAHTVVVSEMLIRLAEHEVNQHEGAVPVLRAV